MSGSRRDYMACEGPFLVPTECRGARLGVPHFGVNNSPLKMGPTIPYAGSPKGHESTDVSRE